MGRAGACTTGIQQATRLSVTNCITAVLHKAATLYLGYNAHFFPAILPDQAAAAPARYNFKEARITAQALAACFNLLTQCLSAAAHLPRSVGSSALSWGETLEPWAARSRGWSQTFPSTKS